MGARQTLSVLGWKLRLQGRIAGSGYFIHPAARVRVAPGVVLRLGRDAHVSAETALDIRADSSIGAGVYIGRNATVVAFSPLTIGPGTLIGENVSIHTENHSGPDLSNFTSASVAIGERCWLCAGVVVTRGASVGDSTIVGANSVVTSAIPSGVIAAGAPARVIRRRSDL